jgi:hypothetical protein
MQRDLQRWPPRDAESERARPKLGQRAVNILARSLYRELRAQGYAPPQIVRLATELLGEVSTAMAACGRTTSRGAHKRELGSLSPGRPIPTALKEYPDV